jgi:dimethylglycine dehydrogenase
MRLEKGYLHWKSDILTEFDPFETGLSFFVNLEKPEFVGKSALIARQAEGLRKKLVCLTHTARNAPAPAGASVVHAGRIIGTVTSGGWGYRIGENIAYAFIDPDLTAIGSEVEIEIIGASVPATICEMGLYDSKNLRVKS